VTSRSAVRGRRRFASRFDTRVVAGQSARSDSRTLVRYTTGRSGRFWSGVRRVSILQPRVRGRRGRGRVRSAGRWGSSSIGCRSWWKISRIRPPSERTFQALRTPSDEIVQWVCERPSGPFHFPPDIKHSNKFSDASGAGLDNHSRSYAKLRKDDLIFRTPVAVRRFESQSAHSIRCWV
jgi:hypothetical protein